MSVIAAGNTVSTGFTVSGDTTGNLVFTTGGSNTVALTLANTQVATFASNVTVTGSITATGGVVQGANAAPTFSAYANANQNPTTSTATKVILQVKEWDTANCFDNTTNYRFTPNVAGYYQINGMLRWGSSGNALNVWVAIYKNGSVYKRASEIGSTYTSGGQITLSEMIYLNGSTDYVELWGYVQGTSPSWDGTSGSPYSSRMSGFLARSA